MSMQEDCGICPPSPELADKIIRSKQRVLARENLPTESTEDLLDFRTYALIASRPKRTRPDTFVSPARAPTLVVGTKRTLVLLIDFSDSVATRSPSDIGSMLFSSGTYATGSMRDFYSEISYSQLDVVGVVSGPGGGWYRAANAKGYYTNGNNGFGSYPQNAQKLVEEAVDLAAPFVDFSQYDNDSDGIVDALIVIAAGSGAEVTGNVDHFWSHKSQIQPKVVNGVTVKTYFMAPEDGRVGVMAHELGHLLCKWPDLYDTDYSSRGTGKWDLMAGGNWNGGGDRPAHPTAFCKVRAGWVQPIIPTVGQELTLRPYAGSDIVYRLSVGAAAGQEYFLLTNRNKKGFDDQLPGEGLIIEHVDENQTNNTDESHYLVDIEQCDGARHLNLDLNSGDPTDPYPAGSNDKFNATSNPSSKAYDGSDSRVTLVNIRQSGDNIMLNVNDKGATEPEKPGCRQRFLPFLSKGR